MTAPATGNPVHGTPRPGPWAGLRVLPHEPVCPECGSADVGIDTVDTGDGIEETAYVCAPCGCAWPLACVCEWGTWPLMEHQRLEPPPWPEGGDGDSPA